MEFYLMKSEKDDIRKVIDDVGPYLNDLDDAKKLLDNALDSTDPEKYLESVLKKSEGTRAGDIRILINRIRKEHPVT
jgi:hypothetical protein